MKIIYLHQYFNTPDMAGGTRSYEMARRLVDAGHEVHMITTDRTSQHNLVWRRTIEAGIHVHWANVPYDNHMSFSRRSISFFSFAFRAIKEALGLNADIIFATSTPLTIAIPALFVSALQRKPFVFEVRDMWPDVPIAIGALRNPLLVMAARWLEHFTYRRAKHIIALAPGMKADIVSKGVSEEKITVIPNGCDLDIFSSSHHESPREEYDWLSGRKMVLFAGTLGMVNGVDYLARLAGRIYEIDREIRFVVIGNGREQSFVKEVAEREGVLNRSFFMFDAISKKKLVAWLQAANLHIALFTGPRVVWKDAVQNKFFDALATGKPIASNFDGWQSQVSVEADVGLILDTDDIDLAATQLVEALRDDSWLASVPDKARILAIGKFNRDVLAEQLRVRLESIVR